jgi:hypothetical protein
MATHEEQDERVLLVHVRFVGRRYHVLSRRRFEDDLRFAPTARRLRPVVIGDLPSGDLDEPRARIFRHTRSWPLERSRSERFLHGVLRGIEVAIATDDGAEHVRRKLAEQRRRTGYQRSEQTNSSRHAGAFLLDLAMFSQ